MDNREPREMRRLELIAEVIALRVALKLAQSTTTNPAALEGRRVEEKRRRRALISWMGDRQRRKIEEIEASAVEAKESRAADLEAVDALADEFERLVHVSDMTGAQFELLQNARLVI